MLSLLTQHEGGHGDLAEPVLITDQIPLRYNGVLLVVETGALADPVLQAGEGEALVGGGEAGEVGLSGPEAVLENVEWEVDLHQAQHQSVPAANTEPSQINNKQFPHFLCCLPDSPISWKTLSISMSDRVER